MRQAVALDGASRRGLRAKRSDDKTMDVPAAPLAQPHALTR
jgi:hypothetical protein